MELTDENLVTSVNVDGIGIVFEKALINTEKKRVIFSELSDDSAQRLTSALAMNGKNGQSKITYLREENGGDAKKRLTLVAKTARFVRLHHKIDLMFYE